MESKDLLNAYRKRLNKALNDGDKLKEEIYANAINKFNPELLNMAWALTHSDMDQWNADLGVELNYKFKRLTLESMGFPS